MDNTLATSNDFNTKAVKVVYLSQNTVSLIETPDQGVIRTFKVCAHGALWKGLSMLTAGISSESVRTAPLKMPRLFKKKP